MFNMNIDINGLTFEETCDMSLEEYNVFAKKRQIGPFCLRQRVGYVRLRWGCLTCYYPDVDGDEIYCVEIGNTGWECCFTNDEERIYHLGIIADEICKRMKNDML